MPDFRVTIRIQKTRKNKKNHWWIRCPVCNTKTHLRKANWERAIEIADRHIHGRAHKYNLEQFRIAWIKYQLSFSQFSHD